jgi:hypothetical protein
MLIQSNSLAATLDAIDEALFYGRELPETQVEAATRWLAGRQVQSGKWAGMFAPTDLDYGQGVRLFSGEKLHTRLAARNILTAEAARALTLLGTTISGVEDVLERANRWLAGQCFADACMVGECAHSGVGLMRYLAVKGGDRALRWLDRHVEMLSQRRDGKGRWAGLPFYYTLLTLAEIDLPSAAGELCYAAPACQRALKRLSGDDPVTHRRRDVVQGALSKCAML